VEGASRGVGLGHEFLRHVERTKLFIHVVDAAAVEGMDPSDAVEKINAELAAYNAELLKRPQIIAANKMDIPGSEERLARLKKQCEAAGFEVFPISAASNKGLDKLMARVGEILSDYPDDIVFESDYEEYREVAPVYKPFTITRVDDGYFAVEGASVERMMGYTNIDTEKGMSFFQKYLREKGINDELEKRGVKEGDTVRISGMEFEYFK
jgi:GTP-binding protein